MGKRLVKYDYGEILVVKEKEVAALKTSHGEKWDGIVKSQKRVPLIIALKKGADPAAVKSALEAKAADLRIKAFDFEGMPEDFPKVLFGEASPETIKSVFKAARL